MVTSLLQTKESFALGKSRMVTLTVKNKISIIKAFDVIHDVTV